MMVFLRVHIFAESPVSVTPSSAGLFFWKSTERQTEIGYRPQAYTLFEHFASLFFELFIELSASLYFFYVYFVH
jgi:hypothetical protein